MPFMNSGLLLQALLKPIITVYTVQRMVNRYLLVTVWGEAGLPAITPLNSPTGFH